MKYVLLVIVFVMELSWCGCSSPVDSASAVAGPSEIPSPLFTEQLAKAKAGDAVAQFELGELYRDGKKVKQSTAQAYAWFTISARNGHPLGKARIRAGWDTATITRGKDLHTILVERYPRAIAFPLEGAYENDTPNGLFTLTLMNSGKYVFSRGTEDGVGDFEDEGTWTYNNGEVSIKGEDEVGSEVIDIFSINTFADLTMIGEIRKGKREDIPIRQREGYRMRKIR